MDIDNTQTDPLQSSENRFDTYDPQLDLARYIYPSLSPLQTKLDTYAVKVPNRGVNSKGGIFIELHEI